MHMCLVFLSIAEVYIFHAGRRGIEGELSGNIHHLQAEPSP
jgi:hypothetical protein